MSTDSLFKKGLSRRSFLAGSAAVLGTVSLGITGCQNPGTGNTSESDAPPASPAENLTITDTLECDVVVCGTGTAGMVASIRAAELGANVIAIEKKPSIGGTSIIAEGMFGVGSKMQQEAGINYTTDEIFSGALVYSHYSANGRVLRRFVDHSGSAVDWMSDHGVKFSQVTSLGISNKVWHVYDGLGAGLFEALEKAAEDTGVEIMTSTPFLDLVEQDGVVTGVIAGAEEDAIQINAKAVVLATGGFSNNDEMIQKYCRDSLENLYCWGVDGHDGDAINAGLRVNAALHWPSAIMRCGFMIPGVPDFTSHFSVGTCFQPCLWVNSEGVRYTNEESVADFTAMANSAAQEKYTFTIMDDQYINALSASSNTDYGDIYGVSGLTELRSQIQEQLDEGNENVLVAQTIEELAELMGVDPDVLEDTIATYNEYCDKGVDEEFCKSPANLHPIATAPFYAFRRMRTFFCTIGGLKVDEFCRVIGEDHEPITGLYAAGCDAAGIYGADYDVAVTAGTQQGWSVNSGMFAAEHIVENLL